MLPNSHFPKAVASGEDYDNISIDLASELNRNPQIADFVSAEQIARLHMLHWSLSSKEKSINLQS